MAKQLTFSHEGKLNSFTEFFLRMCKKFLPELNEEEAES